MASAYAKVTATAKANTEILSFAQNDGEMRSTAK
jgi:hypothetical protein